MRQGTLYIVATPIGNLGDIGQRAVDTLKQVSLIAAEDTRHSKSLLMHLGIDTPMQACHEHNEEAISPRLIDRLEAGEDVALISDAGTPLLSDPGYRLVRLAHQANIRVSPVPGPCAAIAALSASGIATDRFLFVGFPPHKQGARRQFFDRLAQQAATLVCYESSHRILASAADICDALGGEREVVLAREISKTFETIHKCLLIELPEWLENDANQQRGEFVLVIQGATDNQDPQSVSLEAVLKPLLEELSVKQASHLAARITGMKKNQVYKLALELAGK